MGMLTVIVSWVKNCDMGKILGLIKFFVALWKFVNHLELNGFCHNFATSPPLVPQTNPYFLANERSKFVWSTVERKGRECVLQIRGNRVVYLDCNFCENTM